MFSKVLVANRGEIAVRAFRAAYELGAATVAVFSHEDRNSEHRFKADEAYQIGGPGHPVRNYLDPQLIVDVAVRSGADALYPGYGFLSENPALAEACSAAGVTFVGPSAGVLRLTGDKTRAIASATAAGIPTLRSVGPAVVGEDLVRAAESLTYPVYVKAVAGGGGRGMRRVDAAAALRDAVEVCMREAEAAFGDPAVFIEEGVVAPRHIEVQVLADSFGNTVHLFERDCSVQRRHQKVVEIAPAPNLAPDLRERLCADALRFARSIMYVNAGTVEFLVDRDGRHVFIEMNPRIQVEHTVTEEVTDVDLVQAQLRIAAGESLHEIGLSQDSIRLHGVAVQCRITTEDPAAGFLPDTGRIVSYRAPGGAGVRVDAGTLYSGAEVGAHFDSLLAKLTCRGPSFAAALARSRRAVAEFRVRGVTTNVSFLQALLETPDFAAGNLTTSFVDDHPELLTASTPRDRGTKLLQYLADVTVNQPNGPAPAAVSPASKLPELDVRTAPPAGSKQHLDAVGPEQFARHLREQVQVAVTDTTFRDAHQSLLATRVRTFDLVGVAAHIARMTPELLSIEAWGGATYDVALRFLAEDPWERLAAIREAMPNVCVQMLLRGRNTVGYTPYPAIVTSAFVAEAAATGVDIFRIFDAFNDIDQMRLAIDAVRATGSTVAEVAMCYTGDLSDPAETRFTLDYYLRLAEQFVDAGAHVIGIKDMAGLLRVPAARVLVPALRSRFDLPVHLHTHDTTGGQLATLVAAIDAGVDAVDVAAAPMAGTTSQPSLSALVAATDHTVRATGLSLTAVNALEPYWEAMRRLYAPFDAGLRAPTGRVYRHEIPGGQLSNLRQQAIALGLGERFDEIEDMYAAANDLLGGIIKVTPSSKVVGDLALHLVATGADPTAFANDPAAFDVPESVIGLLSGELGTPHAGWPEPFRRKALEGRTYIPPAETLSIDDEIALGATRPATLNRLLFPGPWTTFEQSRESFGDLSVLPTHEFLYGMRLGAEHVVDVEEGKRLILGLTAIGDADARGMRTVIGTVNGQDRQVKVRDRAVQVSEAPTARADRDRPGEVAAPYQGVATAVVAVGEVVSIGARVATIEAMKIEATITAPIAGTVRAVLVARPTAVAGGDLLLVIE